MQPDDPDATRPQAIPPLAARCLARNHGRDGNRKPVGAARSSLRRLMVGRRGGPSPDGQPIRPAHAVRPRRVAPPVTIWTRLDRVAAALA